MNAGTPLMHAANKPPIATILLDRLGAIAAEFGSQSVKAFKMPAILATLMAPLMQAGFLHLLCQQ